MPLSFIPLLSPLSLPWDHHVPVMWFPLSAGDLVQWRCSQDGENWTTSCHSPETGLWKTEGTVESCMHNLPERVIAYWAVIPFAHKKYVLNKLVVILEFYVHLTLSLCSTLHLSSAEECSENSTHKHLPLFVYQLAQSDSRSSIYCSRFEY